MSTPSTPPILCDRFTYETFPVPPGLPPPPGQEHPVLAEYTRGHRENPAAPENFVPEPELELKEPVKELDDELTPSIQREPEMAVVEDADRPYIT